jgi:hypothetical protein
LPADTADASVGRSILSRRFRRIASERATWIRVRRDGLSVVSASLRRDTFGAWVTRRS